MQDRGNLIFGRGVSGALHKITALVGEIKSVPDLIDFDEGRIE